MAKTYTFDEIAGLRKALRAVPRDAQAELRKASLAIADRVAGLAAGRAITVGGVAKYVAPTIKARRDRVPKVVMGGTKRLPGRTGKGQTVGDVMWGAEFGARRHRQFRPWRGSGQGAGYFLWPTVRDQSDETIERYGEALLHAVDKSARRHDG